PARDDVEPDANDRRSVLESLAREKGRTDRSPGPLSVCIFEIDGFDGLTRKHGRAAVGLIQQRLGKRIRGELRAMDGVTPGGARRSFDRTGEERYVALLPQTNLSGAARCAERIRAAIAKYPIDGRYAITVSAGIVEYRRGESAAVLLGRAEAAVSRALEAAGNCIVGSAEGDAVPHADVIPMRGLRS
ncbi:MAG: GGDEF domain-containing protein, partial [Gammaproteobacteria bacterium]